MSLRIVLDTNVLVSALLSPTGAPARILDAVFSNQCVLLFDDRILTEYQQVLARKKFRFDQSAIEDLLDFILASGEPILAEPLALRLKDPSDLPFIEVACSGYADALVTGNKKHFPSKQLSIPIYTPREFLEH